LFASNALVNVRLDQDSRQIVESLGRFLRLNAMEVLLTKIKILNFVGNKQRDLGRMSTSLCLRDEKGETMRSDLIFGALTHVNNRYELCQLASKATRKLHKPNTRLQDTTNEVLDRFKDTVPMDESGEPVVVKVQLQERRAA